MSKKINESDNDQKQSKTFPSFAAISMTLRWNVELIILVLSHLYRYKLHLINLLKKCRCKLVTKQNEVKVVFKIVLIHQQIFQKWKVRTIFGKVLIFWEGHKILQNLPPTFDCMYIVHTVVKSKGKISQNSQNIWTLL